MSSDPRLSAIPDVHGHAKGEHRPYAEERPIPYTARMLFLWFFHACQRGSPRFMMVSDHINFLTFEDPAAVNLVRRALKLAEAGDLYGAAETAGIDIQHAAVVSEGLRRGMRFSIGAEVDNDPRSRPDAINIVEAMRPDAMIRSIHFLTIDHPEHGAGWLWPFDNPEFVTTFEHVGIEKTWQLYMEAVLDAVEKQPGHILGHFYAPAKFGHWPELAQLETYEDQVLDACATRGMAVEINTRLFYRLEDDVAKQRYRDANLRLMRKAKAKNVGIAIASDAHSPKDQGHGFPEILKMLDEAEINELVFPVNGRMARVALRATKEHLEQKAAASGIPPKLPTLPVSEEPEATPVAAKPKKARPAADAADAAEAKGSEKAPKAKPGSVVHSKPDLGKGKHVPAPPLRIEPPAADASTPPARKAAPPAKTAVDVPIDGAKAVPAKAVPVKAAPVKAVPVKAVPVKAVPAKAVPVKAVPVKAVPVKAVPVKAAPVKAAPVKAVPVKAAPAKAAPAKAAKTALPKGGATAKSASPKAAPAKKAVVVKTAAKAPAKASSAKGAAGSKKIPKPVKAKPAPKTKAKPPAKKAVRPATLRKPAAKTKAAPKAKPAAKRPAPAKKASASKAVPKKKAGRSRR